MKNFKFDSSKLLNSEQLANLKGGDMGQWMVEETFNGETTTWTCIAPQQSDCEGCQRTGSGCTECLHQVA